MRREDAKNPSRKDLSSRESNLAHDNNPIFFFCLPYALDRNINELIWRHMSASTREFASKRKSQTGASLDDPG
jgi:hypothetical protein